VNKRHSSVKTQFNLIPVHLKAVAMAAMGLKEVFSRQSKNTIQFNTCASHSRGYGSYGAKKKVFSRQRKNTIQFNTCASHSRTVPSSPADTKYFPSVCVCVWVG